MLVLSRLLDQSVIMTCRCGCRTTTTVVEIRPGSIRLGFDAPMDVVIDREEIDKRRIRDPRATREGGIS